MTGRIGVVIVDDHVAFRKELRQIIEDQPRFEIIGEAGDGEHALDLIRRSRPSIAVLDVSIPPPDGLAVARTLRKEEAPVEIILLTMYREEGILATARSLGLSYVLKDSAMTDIIAALDAAARGERFTSPLLATYLQENARVSPTPLSLQSFQQAVQNLLPMERRLLDLIAGYNTNKDIADKLNMNADTVEDQRAAICQKLGLAGNHALMKFALNYKSPASPDRL